MPETEGAAGAGAHRKCTETADRVSRGRAPGIGKDLGHSGARAEPQQPKHAHPEGPLICTRWQCQQPMDKVPCTSPGPAPAITGDQSWIFSRVREQERQCRRPHRIGLHYGSGHN